MEQVDVHKTVGNFLSQISCQGEHRQFRVAVGGVILVVKN